MEPAATLAESVGLYLSVPFCRSKCSFCNFASGVYPSSELPRYVARLIEDLAGARADADRHGLALPRQVDTVYFGGGTPSILSGAQLRAIFAAMREQFVLRADAEITLEAAPAMLSDDMLSAACESGVTRISFGVQTFVDAEARAVGRLHTSVQALDDVARARRAGLAVSVDLIAGLPGQTESSWRHSLAILGEAAPEHASVYMLEVDEDSRLGGEMLLGGTRYGAGLTPSDDAVADFYTEACSVLASQGLAQYEISNFAHPGQESRHNLRYWQRRPYLGVGLDAHSMLRSRACDPAGALRIKNDPTMQADASKARGLARKSAMRQKWLPAAQAASPSSAAVRFGTSDELGSYLQGNTNGGELHRLTRAEELEEAWFLGLRLTSGVSLPSLRQEFGSAAIEACAPTLAELAEAGLLTLAASHASLTHRGRMFSNEVFASFLGLAQAQPETGGEAPEIQTLAASAS